MGPRALIDLAALRHNLAVVRRLAPGRRVWAVVKADAYGHGMTRVALALPEADGFAVARVEEGLRLREAGIAAPVLVLEGAHDGGELAAAAAAGLGIAVHDGATVAALAALVAADAGAFRAVGDAPPPVWLKVDTGMGRLGLGAEAIAPGVARLKQGLGLRLGLMTHLANADLPTDPLTARQCAQARDLANSHGLPLSIANSAGIVAHPGSHGDWVRPGIMLYGGSPLADGDAAGLDLRPVMTLQSRLIAVRHRPAGSSIGYGGTWVCPEPMPVGVVAIGYGDGYPRHAPTGTPVLLHGRQVPVIGRVSMDMISIDLRGVPEAAVGDTVTLWGAGLPVETIAAQVGTINYELMCRLAPRVRVEAA